MRQRFGREQGVLWVRLLLVGLVLFNEPLLFLM
jgi:hypothetical protein